MSTYWLAQYKGLHQPGWFDWCSEPPTDRPGLTKAEARRDIREMIADDIPLSKIRVQRVTVTPAKLADVGFKRRGR